MEHDINWSNDAMTLFGLYYASNNLAGRTSNPGMNRKAVDLVSPRFGAAFPSFFKKDDTAFKTLIKKLGEINQTLTEDKCEHLFSVYLLCRLIEEHAEAPINVSTDKLEQLRKDTSQDRIRIMLWTSDPRRQKSAQAPPRTFSKRKCWKQSRNSFNRTGEES